jgi:hypothetical protein
MKRLALILVAASALLAPATASADNVVDYNDGDKVASFKSDDTGIANNYIVSVVGDRIRFFDDADPKGTSTYPFANCRASSPTSSGSDAGFREVDCPKEMFKGIILEPGSGEDRAEYKVPDIPGILSGSVGSDTLISGDAADDLSGEQGNDTLSSGNGDDIVNGDEGADKLDSGAGNDTVTGGTGTDTINAGAGDDKLFAADGIAEQVNCGDGADTITADQADTLAGCEDVTLLNVTAAPEEDASTADDKTKPTLAVGGSSMQRLRKSVSFVATCSEKGLVQAIGFTAAGGIKETFKLVERKVDVGGGGVVIKLPFSKRQRSNAARDLKRKRKPRVRVIISCVDMAGNTSSARRFWIGLRRR